MFSLLLHEIRKHRGGIIGWTIGLGLYAVSYMAFYPSMPQEFLEMDLQSIEIYQMFGDMSMATFEGYMASTIFNFLALLLGIFAVVNGTAALAGEEDSGTLELLVALPLPRWQVVLAKALGMGVAALIILALVGLGMAGMFLAIQNQMTATAAAADLLRLTLSYWPFTMAFLMIGLFLGAYLPTRRAAASAATVALLVSYFGHNLAGLFEQLEPLRPLSPFHYLNLSPNALVEGQATGDILVLLAITAVFLLLAIVCFQRRDITVSAWPWQRTARNAGVGEA
jgi:ABC-2 type transport system permease protein